LPFGFVGKKEPDKAEKLDKIVYKRNFLAEISIFLENLSIWCPEGAT